MAAPRVSRRHHQRCPGWLITRMYLCWCLLTSLALAQGESNRFKVTYTAGEKKLRLECPQEKKNEFMASRLARVLNGPTKRDIDLANWMPNRMGNKGESLRDRVTVDNSHQEHLVVELRDVTCLDNATYMCENILGDDQGRVRRVNYTHSFVYTGDVSVPNITKDPLKACYDVSEELGLSCSADISTRDNGILWEFRSPEESSFSPVSPDTLPGASISDEEIRETKDCVLRSTRHLHLRLKREHDGIFFQCRLNRTSNSSQTTVTLPCQPDNHDVTSSGAGAASRISLALRGMWPHVTCLLVWVCSCGASRR